MPPKKDDKERLVYKEKKEKPLTKEQRFQEQEARFHAQMEAHKQRRKQEREYWQQWEVDKLKMKKKEVKKYFY